MVPRFDPDYDLRYIGKPLLINKKKFDLRIYILVTSFDPLRVYYFEEGLVRFATQEYSGSKKRIKNRFMHLTNYSINKDAEEFREATELDDTSGHKWSLKVDI